MREVTESEKRCKVQLIFPEGGVKLTSSGILPPIGIVSLATYLKDEIPNTEIQLFDGEVTSTTEIIDSLDADVVGISITGANYRNALRIAREAKRKGARVVFGGSQATTKHRTILDNETSVDAVIRGEGEKALVEYIEAATSNQEEAFGQISNLTYRTFDGKVKVNQTAKKCEQLELDGIPSPDYSLLEDSLAEYERNFQQHKYRKEGFTRFVSMESQKGCAKTERVGEGRGRCTFCARIDKGLRRISPSNFWKRVEKLYDPDGRTMIWDVSDSFSGSTTDDDSWLEQVAQSKPAHLEGKVSFKIFARADELTKESVQYLNKIGVEEVFIGVESGDQDKLDSINKGCSPEDNAQAIKNLNKYGMSAYVSIIYGLPGEDADSLQRTYQHVEELLREDVIEGIGARCLFPFPGMKVHTDLSRKIRSGGDEDLAKKVRNFESVDIPKLQELWLDYMTNTNLEEIQAVHEKMMALAGKYDVRINGGERLIIS